MIEPFADNQVRKGVISYGVLPTLRHAGGAGVQDLHPTVHSTVDPQELRRQVVVEYEGMSASSRPTLCAWPRRRVFRIPANVLTIGVGQEHLRPAVSSPT